MYLLQKGPPSSVSSPNDEANFADAPQLLHCAQLIVGALREHRTEQLDDHGERPLVHAGLQREVDGGILVGRVEQLLLVRARVVAVEAEVHLPQHRQTGVRGRPSWGPEWCAHTSASHGSCSTLKHGR